MFCWNSAEIYKEKKLSLEEMDIRQDILVPGVSGENYHTEAVFYGGQLEKVIERYDHIWEEDVEKFLWMICDTNLNGIMVVPIGCCSWEANEMINRYTPKIQLYRTGVEGKSC